MVVGGALVLAITYQSGTASSDSANPESPPVDGPVAPHIDWVFIERLSKAEVKTGVEAAEETQAVDSEPKEYVLHAAQFLREEDAQVLRAELMLDGLPVSLSSSPRDRGGAWHRVLVGPYATKPDARQVLGKLRARDIPAHILARPLAGSTPPT